MILLFLACSQPPARVRQTPPPGPPYAERVARIQASRHELVLEDALVELIDAWKGTPWDFYGTAREPGDDPIACGHFVAGVLHDAGLQVERTKLGQQAAEHIIQTLTSEASIVRYRGKDVERVVAGVEASGDGVYVGGLDTHVGFLVHDEGATRFCHSSWIGGVGVLCEPASSSPALPSRYTVVGKLGEPALVQAWHDETPIPTVTR